jgi:hypothetical protein
MTTRKNLYPGVNPHLNSVLQSPEGGWVSFHADYIGRLADFLEQVLPDNYSPMVEKSLQVGILDLTDTPKEGRSRTRPDVVVLLKTEQERQPLIAASHQRMPTLSLPIIEEFDDEDDFYGLVIYRMEGKNLPGMPVARFEVLSPANKPGGSHYDQYMSNRRRTLYSGLNLVEIDFLHERHPILPKIPRYLLRDSEAHPYYILVTDPRPTIHEGMTDIFGFDVHEVVPILPIPLDGEDEIEVDFGKVYDLVIENRRALRSLIKYDEKPEHFETYSTEDQQYILQRMAEIADSENK